MHIPQQERIKRPETEAVWAVLEPDEFVAGLIDGDNFTHDPGTLKHTWPEKKSGWAYVKGETAVGDNVYPTSVTVYFPLMVERLVAKMFGGQANARIDLRVGDPIPSPDEAAPIVIPAIR